MTPSDRNPTMVPDDPPGEEAAAHATVVLDGSGGRPLAEGGREAGPGVTLGHYRLVRPLGTGSTAEVWWATDTRLERHVALKLFHRNMSGRREVARVMAEAWSAGAILSDHVVRVREAGWLEEIRQAFIAMELCAEAVDDTGAPTVGRPLLEETPRDLREAVAWALDIARGVRDAHRVGVFHRDLKPDNVLVRPASRKVQILDFGLAALGSGVEDEAGTSHVTIWRRTPQGRRVVAGTPAYMAPEQAEGLPARLDPVRDRALLTAVDIYGIGAVLYALLAGRPPHVRPGEAPPSALEMLQRVRSAPPPSLARVPTRFRVPARLRRIVERCMARDPDERFVDADEVVDALEAFLAHRPSSVDAGRPLLRLGLLLRRRAREVLAAMWMLAIGGGVIVSHLLLEDVREARDRLVATRAELARASDRLDEQRQATAALQGALEEQREEGARQATRVARLERRRRDLERQVALLGTRASELETQLGDRTAQVEALEEELAGVRAELESARSDLEATRTERDAVVAALARTRSDRDRLEARAGRLERSLAEARASRDAARTDLARLKGEAEARAARDARTIGDLRARLGAAEGSLADLRRRLEAVETERAAAAARVSGLEAEVAELQRRLRAASAVPVQGGSP